MIKIKTGKCALVCDLSHFPSHNHLSDYIRIISNTCNFSSVYEKIFENLEVYFYGY